MDGAIAKMQEEGLRLIGRYFELSQEQKDRFTMFAELYKDWNRKINVVSRKDIDELYLRHVLHSLAIARKFSFMSGQRILDVGTGGGFPGIPLAVLFPEAKFHLVDSIGKKIKVVQAVVEGLELKNVTTAHIRAEEVKGSFDYVVTRAVAPLETLWYWVGNKLSRAGESNGLIALKGGDLAEETAALGRYCEIYELTEYFEEPFFETKKLVYVPV